MGGSFVTVISRCPLVVIRDLYLIGVVSAPDEANAPLLVDTDTVLSTTRQILAWLVGSVSTYRHDYQSFIPSLLAACFCRLIRSRYSGERRI